MITKDGMLKCKFNVCLNLIVSYQIKAVKYTFLLVINMQQYQFSIQ